MHICLNRVVSVCCHGQNKRNEEALALHMYVFICKNLNLSILQPRVLLCLFKTYFFDIICALKTQ